MMRKCLAAAAVLIATLAIGSFTPAHADEQRPPRLSAEKTAVPPVCTASGYTPTSATIATRAVNVTFQQVGDCPIWVLDVPELFLFADESASVHTFSPNLLRNTDAGRKAGTFTYCDDATFEACGELSTSFVLRRYTSFGGTFDAYPEPIDELATLRMTATLQRYNWETGRFDPYTPNNGIAVIQFQPVGGHFFDYKEVAIGPRGVVNGAVVARLDGAWRYRFAGTNSAGAQFSLPDYVEVR